MAMYGRGLRQRMMQQQGLARQQQMRPQQLGSAMAPQQMMSAGIEWPPKQLGQRPPGPAQQQQLMAAYQQQLAPRPLTSDTQMVGPQQIAQRPPGLMPYHNTGQPFGPPASRPYGGGPGFAKPLSPSPSGGGGGAGGGGAPPTSWKMSIEPMSHGGIIGLEGGGYVPMVYVNGGYIPAYGLGGWLKKAGKGILKAAPMAASFIPGIGPLAAGAIGAIGGAGSSLVEGGDLGSALQKGIMAGMGSYAGRKGVMGAKEGWEKAGAEGLGFGAKLEAALGGAKGAFDMKDLIMASSMAPQLEGTGVGGGAAPAGRIMPGGGGAVGGRGTSAGVSTITDVGPATSQAYNLFDQLKGRRGGGMVPGYDVGNLYANRRFGGGMIPGYRRGGEYDEPERARRPSRRTRGRRGRRRAPVRRLPFDPRQVDVENRQAELAAQQQQAALQRQQEMARLQIPPPPPVARDIPEDIEEFVPETVAAAPPPPPVAPPPQVLQPPPPPGGEEMDVGVYAPPVQAPAPPPFVPPSVGIGDEFEEPALPPPPPVAPPAPVMPPPPPPPVGREEEFEEPALPPPPVAPPPPPPVAPPLVEEFGDEFDEPTLPPLPPIQQPQPPPGVPVFDPRQVDVENQQAELAAAQRQPPPPPVFDPTQVGPPDYQLAIEGDGGEPPGMGPPPVPRARPQPQPEPFVDDEEPIDQQLAPQLPYTVPQPAVPPPQQGPQPPAGVPVFDPRQVDLQNAIEEQKAQDRAVALGAEPFVPSPYEEGNGNGATEGPDQFEPSRTGVPEPEPTARVNVPRQLTEEQRDNLDEMMFAPPDETGQTVETEFGTQTSLYGEEPEATFTPETGRPTPVIEPPAGVPVFDPTQVVKADEAATTKALEDQLAIAPDNKDVQERLERKYEKQNEAAATEVEETGVPTGPMESAEAKLKATKDRHEAERKAREAQQAQWDAQRDAYEASLVPKPAARPTTTGGPGLGLFGGPGAQPTAPAAPAQPPMFEASGFDPFNMPTTAAQFTQAGDPAAAAMLERMNAPAAPVQSYVPTAPAPATAPPTTSGPPPALPPVTKPGMQEGGLIEGEGSVIEELSKDETGNQVLQVVLQALQTPDDPQSSEIITGFVEAFGEEALMELMQFAGGGAEGAMPVGAMEEPAIPEMPLEAPVAPQAMAPMQMGGLIPGNGDAMADNIVTTADRGTPSAQDIAISSGEYVVAGDVVSGLGSGNSEAGAEVLDQLQQDVRIDRTGSPEQPPPIDLSEVLPATYGGQYA